MRITRVSRDTGPAEQHASGQESRAGATWEGGWEQSEPSVPTRTAGQGWATWWTQGFIRLRVGGGLGPSKLSALPPINASKSAVPS